MKKTNTASTAKNHSLGVAPTKKITTPVIHVGGGMEKVLRAFMQDDFVSDHGWRSPEAAAWMNGFHKDAGMDGKEFAGMISAMSKAGLIRCSSMKEPVADRAFSRTDAGRAACEQLEKEDAEEAPVATKKVKKAKKEVEVEEVTDAKKAKKAKKEVEVEEPVVKAKKAKKEKTPMDEFGNREGTQAAAINALILSGVKTQNELIEITKYSRRRVILHIAYLVRHGKLLGNSKGYSIPASK